MKLFRFAFAPRPAVARARAGLVRKLARLDADKIRRLEAALDRANAVIGEQADEMKALTDEIDTFRKGPTAWRELRDAPQKPE